MLFGAQGLCRASPELALTMMVTVPSGAPEVVALHDKLVNLSGTIPCPPVRPGLAKCRHSDVSTEAWPSGTVYTGCGRLDPQGRPSPYCNPFINESDVAGSVKAFTGYLCSRADLQIFLAPLRGAVCVGATAPFVG